ncbi:MAG: hypothetical protein HQM09_04890 [Candidatus Riflebacteria bacterium]|nr:hypothetical protein [Candidatus Riflebacteria bacterium]
MMNREPYNSFWKLIPCVLILVLSFGVPVFAQESQKARYSKEILSIDESVISFDRNSWSGFDSTDHRVAGATSEAREGIINDNELMKGGKPNLEKHGLQTNEFNLIIAGVSRFCHMSVPDLFTSLYRGKSLRDVGNEHNMGEEQWKSLFSEQGSEKKRVVAVYSGAQFGIWEGRIAQTLLMQNPPTLSENNIVALEGNFNGAYFTPEKTTVLGTISGSLLEKGKKVYESLRQIAAKKGIQVASQSERFPIHLGFDPNKNRAILTFSEKFPASGGFDRVEYSIAFDWESQNWISAETGVFASEVHSK